MSEAAKCVSPSERQRDRTRTAPITLRRRRRIAEALALREQGYSFAKIARAMRISKSTAHGLIVDGLAELADVIHARAAALRELELRRLDAVQTGVYAKAVEGDIAALDIVLKIIDRRVALLGLIPKPAKPVDPASSGPAPIFKFADAPRNPEPADPLEELLRMRLAGVLPGMEERANG